MRGAGGDPSPLSIDSGRRGGLPGFRFGVTVVPFVIGVPTCWGVLVSLCSCATAATSVPIVPPSSVTEVSCRSEDGFGSVLARPSTSSAVKTIRSASISRSGWNSSQLLSSLGLYPSLACVAAAAAAALLYLGLVAAMALPRVLALSRYPPRDLGCVRGLTLRPPVLSIARIGVSSTSASLFAGAVTLMVKSSGSVDVGKVALSMVSSRFADVENRPLLARDPCVSFRRLLGGSESGALGDRIRGRPGGRPPRRGLDAETAIVRCAEVVSGPQTRSLSLAALLIGNATRGAVHRLTTIRVERIQSRQDTRTSMSM